MAYVAIGSLLQILDTILQSSDGGLQFFRIKRQLESLREKVSFLQDFLENSSQKASNELIEVKIRDVAYAAEDLFELGLLNHTLSATEFRRDQGLFFQLFVTVWKNFFSAIQNVMSGLVRILIPIFVKNVRSVGVRKLRSASRQQISEPKVEDLCQIIKKIDSIMEEVIKNNEACGVGRELSQTRNVLPSTSASRLYFSGGDRKNTVVGFDSDLAQIKNRLTEASNKLEILSIVGMGGIGKTTLARQVYDDAYVQYHFDTHGWVAVSQEHSLRQVLVGLLDSTKILTEEMQEETDERLAEYLYKSLKNQRFLIVMDDIWDTEIWDALKRSFPDDSNGSRILLTTRLSGVALYANSFSPLHKMHFLNRDESWKLLCKKVFAEEECSPKLEEIGKMIAKNCGGLPLLIVVIGGLLSKVSRTEASWRSVAENLNSIVTRDDQQCVDILSLSYNFLPHHLKACFLYMGVFTKGCDIPVSKLIHLWAAEGFLKPDRSKSLEQVANGYLNDLIDRSLILICKRSSDGKIKTCNIHDLLRDLCVRNARKDNFFHVVNSYADILQVGTTSQRRLSIHPDALYIEQIYSSTHSMPLARSLLCTGTHLSHPLRVYLGFKLLKVLDVVIVYFNEFPVEIFNLVNLRYLAFAYNGSLPPSISKLSNLQTIIHHSWTFGQCPLLPVEIWMMPNLRHLVFMPSYLPDPFGAHIVGNNFFLLESLQTLSEVRNLRCSQDIFGRIPNLKKLVVSYDVSHSAKWPEYQLEGLINLRYLETLKFLVKNPLYGSDFVYPPKLAFPDNLRKLTLGGCGILWENMTIIGRLPNLEVLKLRKNAGRGIEWEPIEGEFTRLKVLLLEDLNLVHWKADETHFPCLQSVVIRSCFKLKMVPSGIGEIPTLQMIELIDCLSSAVTSAKQILEEQQSLGNDDLQVRFDLRRRFKDRFNTRILR